MSLIMDVLNREKKTHPEPPIQTKSKKSKVIVQAEPKLERSAAAAVIPGIDIGKTRIIEEKILTQRIISSSSGESSKFKWVGIAVIALVIGVIAVSVLYFWKTTSWKFNLYEPKSISSPLSPTGKTAMTPWDLTAKVVEKKDQIFSSPRGLNLEGIILGDQKPMTIINGEILSVGDRFKDYEITVIDKRGVYLLNGKGEVTFLQNKG